MKRRRMPRKKGRKGRGKDEMAKIKVDWKSEKKEGGDQALAQLDQWQEDAIWKRGGVYVMDLWIEGADEDPNQSQTFPRLGR